MSKQRIQEVHFLTKFAKLIYIKTRFGTQVHCSLWHVIAWSLTLRVLQARGRKWSKQIGIWRPLDTTPRAANSEIPFRRGMSSASAWAGVAREGFPEKGLEWNLARYPRWGKVEGEGCGILRQAGWGMVSRKRLIRARARGPGKFSPALQGLWAGSKGRVTHFPLFRRPILQPSCC